MSLILVRVGGGVSGWDREGVPRHELLHQGEEQLEAHTWYKHQARVVVCSYLVSVLLLN